MDFKLLEDFICLARLESFTAASRERSITQSALSRRIRSLERWLGTELINRDRKVFTLTPQGRVFVPEAQMILRRLYNAREMAGVLETNGTYEITVAAQNSIAQTLFLDWAKQLEGQIDNIFIRLLSEKLSACVGLLHQGVVNYLFCYARESIPLPIDENRFKFMTIGRELLVPVTVPGPGGTPMHSLPGSPEKPLPFVAYDRDSVFGRAVDQLIQNHSDNCFLSRRYENPYSHTLRSLVKEELGLAWLPRTTIVSDLKNGSLCRAGDEKWDIEFDIRLYYHHEATSSHEMAVLETSRAIASRLSSKT